MAEYENYDLNRTRCDLYRGCDECGLANIIRDNLNQGDIVYIASYKKYLSRPLEKQLAKVGIRHSPTLISFQLKGKEPIIRCSEITYLNT